MKNITIAIDDETHRAARIRAAELGTSVSALVKGYLQGLTAGPPAQSGVREVPMPFKNAPQEAKPDGPPWLVDGKWVYTPDGKPRQPGSMREQFKDLPEDWDEWSPEMLAFFDKLQNEPWDDGDPADDLLFDERQLPLP
jgi:plasmid stability protein